MANLGNTKENSYFFNSSKASFKNARKLREKQTEAEELLWEALRNRQVNGLKFRRQHPVSSFVVDFYCHEAQIIIELDGSIHDDPEVAERDQMRSTVFEERELKIIRFRNEEVLEDLNTVILRIKSLTNNNQFLPPRPPGEGDRGGEGFKSPPGEGDRGGEGFKSPPGEGDRGGEGFNLQPAQIQRVWQS